jgi:hypothetical protein
LNNPALLGNHKFIRLRRKNQKPFSHLKFETVFRTLVRRKSGLAFLGALASLRDAGFYLCVIKLKPLSGAPQSLTLWAKML